MLEVPITAMQTGASEGGETTLEENFLSEEVIICDNRIGRRKPDETCFPVTQHSYRQRNTEYNL